MIKVIDNFLTPTYADTILQDARSVLQYFYMSETCSHNERTEGPPFFKDANTFDFGQFTCPILVHPEPSPVFGWYFTLLKPVIYTLIDKVPEIAVRGVVRIKFNLLLKHADAPADHYNIPHQDAFDSAYSMVYYCDDSDGDTFLFKEFYQSGKLPEKLTLAERVTPRKNRVVVFESNRYHASSNPRSSRDRIVANFIFEANKR